MVKATGRANSQLWLIVLVAHTWILIDFGIPMALSTARPGPVTLTDSSKVFLTYVTVDVCH